MQRLLFIAQVALLRLSRALVVDTCLPGWHAAHEHLLDIFERLSARLGEAEEDVDGHGCAEDTEDDVHLPLDVDERGRDEVREGEVEDPVGARGDGDGLATDA